MKSGTVAGEGAVQDGDHVQPGGERAVDEGDACWRLLGQFRVRMCGEAWCQSVISFYFLGDAVIPGNWNAGCGSWRFKSSFLVEVE